MARAKRTDRAEARRRHRATFADPLADGEGAAAEDAPASIPVAGSRAATGGLRKPAAPAPGQPVRPSVTSAFTSSFRQVDLRSDVRLLPKLLVHRAFLAPTVASGLAFVLFAYFPSPPTVLFYKYFSYQLPVAALFVAGFFAPRASYLIGAIVGVASVLFQAPLWMGQTSDFAIGSLVSGALGGALFASMAAWYRRFLRRANPNRARPTQPSGRRPDGKIPKKDTPRPMLARRR